MQKRFVIHTGDSAFFITGLHFRGDTAVGVYEGTYRMSDKMNIPGVDSTKNHPVRAGESIDDIHLFVNQAKNTPVPGYFESSFAYKDVWMMNINRRNEPLTYAQKTGRFLMGAAGVVLFGSVIIAATSCPFVYTDSGNGYVVAGEIYSGAIYAPLERNDFLALSHPVEKNGLYQLKMTNEAKEIQNTNLAELFVIDHPAGTEVLYDKYGSYQTLSEPFTPYSAKNFNGADVGGYICRKDNLSYIGDIQDNIIPLTDGIIMSFIHPEGVTSGKLIIRARNSVWLDYVYKNSHELFGSYYNDWVKRQNRRTRDDMSKWPLDQKIPLMVYVERNGKWEFYDYFNNAGPACLRDDVLAIDLSGLDSDTVRIKLEAGAFFWEIDYAAMDFSPKIPVNFALVQINKAITNKENDVAGMLRFDDLKYYSQADIGDEAVLEFASPPLIGEKRSVFLHSKGYYQILSDARGLPKTRQLKELRQPMKFPEFSRKLMMEKITEYNGKKR